MENKEVLLNWLEGNLTDDQVEREIGSEEFQLYKKIIDTSSKWESPKRKSSHREAFLKKMQSVKKRKANTKILLKYAAVFLIGVSSVLVFFANQNIITANGNTKIVSIFDGSTIKLAPNSSLSYNSVLYFFNRKVTLEGNAFFNVIPGNSFTVNSPNGEVSVLGTSFNIIDREDYFNVVCFTGKVAVKANKQEVILKPLEGFENLSNKKSKFNNASKDPSNNSYLYLNQVPLPIVLKELSNFYNVTFNTDAVSLEGTYNGLLINDNIELALKNVLYPFNFDFEWQKDNFVVIIPRQ
jgi:ferric-dicitrate binding protein FerR (iron transport regulator)